MPTLNELIKDLKDYFDTVEDIFLTYQNDIYRQSSDDFEDLRDSTNNIKKTIKALEEKEELLSKDRENKTRSFISKDGQRIIIPDKSQWKNSKKFYNKKKMYNSNNNGEI